MRGEIPEGGLANAEQAAVWAGEGEHWARHDDRYNASVRQHSARLLAAAAVSVGESVVDIGCGCGDSTRQAARRAGAVGRAIGADLSARMLERARQRSREEALENVDFRQVDVQVHPFAARSFDVALSRFGATFFADAVAAFANVARALRPGGRLALLAWHDVAHNQWLGTLRAALAAGRALPSPVPGEPGPFAFSDPRRARSVLSEAGFRAIVVEAVDDPVLLGTDGDDAFDFVSGIGMTRALLHGLDAPTARRALARLRADLHAADRGGRVLLGSAAWLITATRP
ncbi:MAG: class I SAM-dependent methyltransferase [Acidimicrobiales bacterium]